MNPLLRKEARLLLPGFAVGLVLALSIWLLPNGSGSTATNPATTLLFALFIGGTPAAVVALTLGSFGREFAGGTFPFLLSQPVSRARIWWTKTLLLAAAVGITGGAWWFSLAANPEFARTPAADRTEALESTLLFLLAAYSSGLWTTLFFRQVALAFWFTVLTPALLWMGVSAVVTRLYPLTYEAHLNFALLLAFSVYALAGFLLARWLFLRAQDAHWTGGELRLPSAGPFSGSLLGWLSRGAEGRHFRPRAALWRKELQLQHTQFLLGGVLLVLHLLILATRRWGGGPPAHPTLAFVLDQFWVFWLVLPLLVGCASVAEERRLGTLQSQLCLAVPARTQFLIKITSVLLISLLLGAVLPSLLDGSHILPDWSATETPANNFQVLRIGPGGFALSIGDIVSACRAARPFLAIAGISLVTGFLSFYTSSLGRNTVQTLAPAVLVLLAVVLLAEAADNIEVYLHYPLWRSVLAYLIGAPVLSLAFVALAYWNCQRVQVTAKVWRRNGLVLLLAVAGIIATNAAVYNRVWELFVVLEPEPPGPTRLATDPASPRSFELRALGDLLAVQFPDGRHWSTRVTLRSQGLAAGLSGEWDMIEIPGEASFLEETNWASVASCYRDVVGVRQDGTLWVSETPRPLGLRVVSTQARPAAAPPPRLIQLGQDHDWQAVAGHSDLVFLLKTNGSLWTLGSLRADWKNWAGFKSFVPEQVRAGQTWSRIFHVHHGRIAFETVDGQTWVYPPEAQQGSEALTLTGGILVTRAPQLEGQRATASTWFPFGDARSFTLGVGEDGVMRVIGYWGRRPESNVPAGRQAWGFMPVSIELGTRTNWVTVADNRQDVVALDQDGTLWKWQFPADPIAHPERAVATRLSRRSDWLALTVSMDGMVALAADGSLWFWAMEGRRTYPAESFAIQPLLCASRRPQRIAEIFSRR